MSSQQPEKNIRIDESELPIEGDEQGPCPRHILEDIA
jgi:hypothetical protein